MKKLDIILFLNQVLIGVFLLMVLLSCAKDKLKPEDYKFYCKVDDVEWKRSKEGVFCPGCEPIESEYYPNGSILAPPGKFEIIARRDIESKGVREFMYFSVWGGLKEGENKLTRTKRVFINYAGICTKQVNYDIDSTFNYQFIVHELDTIKKRISGEFELRLVSYDCTPPDTIRITDGHFNLNPTWHQ